MEWVQTLLWHCELGTSACDGDCDGGKASGTSPSDISVHRHPEPQVSAVQHHPLAQMLYYRVHLVGGAMTTIQVSS
jgi:hypothetical protein